MVTKLLTDVVVELKVTGTFSVFSLYLNVSLNNIDIRRDSRSCKNPGIGHMGRGSREGSSQRVCLGSGTGLDPEQVQPELHSQERWPLQALLPEEPGLRLKSQLHLYGWSS